MDYLPDEQKRQISMKSACVSLLFKDKEQEAALQAQGTGTRDSIYQINLVDSPGHVDFSSEVSTAVRLSDGGLVLVDVVEGICVQTQAVLKQAWEERLRVVLVLNKMDRLITELKMTAEDAYDHVARLIENVNAVVSAFHTADTLNAASDSSRVEYDDSQQWIFTPQNDNVVFASVIDGWAFTTRQFASLYAERLGMKQEALQQVLWGQYYFNPKKKSVSRKPN